MAGSCALGSSALRTLPKFEIYYGHFLTHTVKMPLAYPVAGQPRYVDVIKTEEKVYSITRLNQEIRRLLENRFPAVWVEAEISNFKHHTSGHMYFTLKDAQAQIRGVMFRGYNRLLRFQPADGLENVLAADRWARERAEATCS